MWLTYIQIAWAWKKETDYKEIGNKTNWVTIQINGITTDIQTWKFLDFLPWLSQLDCISLSCYRWKKKGGEGARKASSLVWIKGRVLRKFNLQTKGHDDMSFSMNVVCGNEVVEEASRY